MLREDLRAMLREQVESKLGKDRSPENLGSLDLKFRLDAKLCKAAKSRQFKLKVVIFKPRF